MNQEQAALTKRRLSLLQQLAKVADEIGKIDDRLSGRPGRGPLRQQETRKDYRKADFDGCDHQLDGCDPDQEPYP